MVGFTKGMFMEIPNPSIGVTACNSKVAARALQCVLVARGPCLSSQHSSPDGSSSLLPPVSISRQCCHTPYSGSFYTWHIFFPFCVLTLSTMEEHIHFSLGKTHCREGREMSPCKAAAHLSCQGVTEMPLMGSFNPHLLLSLRKAAEVKAPQWICLLTMSNYTDS